MNERDSGPDPGAATDGDRGCRVLVPVAVLEGETVPDSIATLLGTLPVVVLGYHVLPEQTPPGQARLQFEDRAQTKVDELAALFREAGNAVETRLVFTHDREQTVDRVAEETGCEAVLVPNPAASVERLLVPLGGSADAPRIAAFVADVVGDRPIEVTLLRVVGDESGVEAGRAALAETATTLRERGLRVTETVEVAATPVEVIADAADVHDAVVMGEGEPSLRSFVFGEKADRVADRSLGPVIVVRSPDDGAESETTPERE